MQLVVVFSTRLPQQVPLVLHSLDYHMAPPACFPKMCLPEVCFALWTIRDSLGMANRLVCPYTFCPCNSK